MTLNKLVFSMNFLFSSYSLDIISWTVFLNYILSIAQKAHGPSHLIEADLLAPYKSANSPKASPGPNFLLTLSFIITSHSPFSIMKYEAA